MKSVIVLMGALLVLAACQTTSETRYSSRAGYSASGMCMGGANCGGGR